MQPVKRIAVSNRSSRRRRSWLAAAASAVSLWGCWATMAVAEDGIATQPRPGDVPAVAAQPTPGAASETLASDADCDAETTEPSATCVLEGLHELLSATTAAPDLTFEQRCEILTPGVIAAYDLQFMAKRSLGQRGNGLTGAQRQQWVDAFTRMTVATYARRLSESSGPRKFEILGERAAPRDTVLVLGRVVGSDRSPMPINYRMHRIGGTWKIVDVYANGTISQLALRRAEVASLFERMSFDEVVAYIDTSSRNP